MKGVDNALQVSKQLPFLEYNLHGRLLNRTRMKGMNAIFNLQVRVTVGDTMTVAIAVSWYCVVRYARVDVPIQPIN